LNPFRALRYTTLLDPRLHRRLLKFRPFRPKKTAFLIFFHFQITNIMPSTHKFFFRYNFGFSF
jgi:hypothetical protein